MDTPPPTTPSTPTDTEPTNRDLMKVLAGLTTKVDTLNDHFSELRDKVRDLTRANNDMQDTISSLIGENKQLRMKNDQLQHRLDETNFKVDDIEGRSRRNNLIFYGINDDKEKSRDPEVILRDTLTNEFGVDMENVELDRVHRIPSARSPQPIIARFASYKQKQHTVSECRKKKHPTVRVSEDYTRRVRDVRKKLIPFLDKFRQEGKRATLVYDHLLVDGKRYNWDEVANTVQPTGPKRINTSPSE